MSPSYKHFRIFGPSAFQFSEKTDSFATQYHSDCTDISIMTFFGVINPVILEQYEFENEPLAKREEFWRSRTMMIPMQFTKSVF